MKLITRKAKLLMLLFAIVSLLFGAGIVHATALYNATAQSRIIISNVYQFDGSDWDELSSKPDDLKIAGRADLANKTEYTIGNASATAEGTLLPDSVWEDIFTGDRIEQKARAYGNADAPPFSWAESDYSTNGNIYIENWSATESYKVDFTYTWGYSTYTSLDNPTYEYAEADIWLNIGTSGLGDFLDLEIGSNARDSGSGTFSVCLDPLQSDTVINHTDAMGGAAVVPEPATMLLLGSGLVGFAGFKRKFRKI
jgi:hypothetical protein